MIRVSGDWLQSPAAQQVCALLAGGGYQAWFVGGCVRNSLLGAPVADVDICTDARPDAVVAMARAVGVRAIPTGIEHGTVTLIADETPFEVTTFRRDVATDGRRATVAFADTISEDATRRDFTMNALYAAANGEFADPLGGLTDLWARRVRFIGDAEQRIREDYLRILRFFRFHAWYGDASGGLDADGLAACAAHIDGLADLSKERVTAELLRLLAAPDPAPAVASFAASGGLAQVVPGASVAALAVLVDIEAMLGLPPDALRRLAALGGDRDRRLRLSKAQARYCAAVTSGIAPRELAYREGFAIGRDACLLEAAALGQPVVAPQLAALEAAAAQVFPLSAADLMPQVSGPALGHALKQAEARWIASGFTLTKDDLIG